MIPDKASKAEPAIDGGTFSGHEKTTLTLIDGGTFSESVEPVLVIIDGGTFYVSDAGKPVLGPRFEEGTF